MSGARLGTGCGVPLPLNPIEPLPKIKDDIALAVDAALRCLHLVNLALLVLEARSKYAHELRGVNVVVGPAVLPPCVAVSPSRPGCPRPVC